MSADSGAADLSALSSTTTADDANAKTQVVITEGKAKITSYGKVFYNPVQEFNRDLSCSVLTTFAKWYLKERKSDSTDEYSDAAGIQCPYGLSVLEALSATGLRSIRYAREVPGIKAILANDISASAVSTIKDNITQNGIENLVKASHNDATLLMYEHRHDQFDAIDLDPYGCPATFLDSAVQAVKDGGLLLVTATDMAVLAGNSPETCYSKYGAISLRIKSCHEMALRILLQCIESHANRYGRYIVPQLSISADFYVRVFVRVYSGASKCKYTTSKLAMVFRCTGCDSFHLQPLGVVRQHDKAKNATRFALPTGPFPGTTCEHCRSSYHMGGPIWTAPLHDADFVRAVLKTSSVELGTFRRIEGMLNVVLEELADAPLYYTLEKLSSVLHVETPPMMLLRSALLNAGYRVSFTHAHKTSIKTDAPAAVVWDVMRAWVRDHPIAAKWLGEDTVAARILARECAPEAFSFAIHPEANPPSRMLGYRRFQENPSACWGPGSRATTMMLEEQPAKRKRNQGKRKRDANKSVDVSSSTDGDDHPKELRVC